LLPVFNWLSVNRASVMTGAAVVGIGALGVVSFRSGMHCAPIIERYQNDLTLTPQEKRRAIATEVIPYLIPPVLIATATGAAVLGSYSHLMRDVSAANAVAAMCTTTMQDLRQQMKDELGPTAAQRIEDHTIEREVKRVPVSDKIAHTGHGETLVRNMIGGGDFYACYEYLKECFDWAAQYALRNGSVSINTLLNQIGISSIDIGYNIGWTDKDVEQNNGKLPVDITAILDEEYKPIYAISSFATHELWG